MGPSANERWAQFLSGSGVASFRHVPVRSPRPSSTPTIRNGKPPRNESRGEFVLTHMEPAHEPNEEIASKQRAILLGTLHGLLMFLLSFVWLVMLVGLD